jgi:hypothetical protein
MGVFRKNPNFFGIHSENVMTFLGLVGKVYILQKKEAAVLPFSEM